MLTDLPTTTFLDLDFVDGSYDAIATELDRMSRARKFATVITPNVDHIVMLHNKSTDDVTERFRNATSAAGMLICDSRVLSALAALRGIKLQVVTGSDLTAYLFEHGFFDNRRVALIGGDQDMLSELSRRYPTIHLFQHIPPMGVLGNEEAIKEIETFVAANGFDYVLFAMGAPRSEIIAQRCSQLPGATGVALCIGASIEFLLGRKARAPRWVQMIGMEWAFRLMSEPRRLWRRYLVSGPKVFLIVRNWQRH
jgi:N-acetylglucosaminyldiphosphoundecaprenol N-acetyl-beta-D-mannosaminyltransferase